MAKMIILEGPRGVGKTSVANEMLNILRKAGKNGQILKMTRGDNPWRDMLQTVNLFITDTTDTVFIIDRFHVTEAVMRVAERWNVFDEVQRLFALDGLMKDFHIRTTILMASKKLLSERVAKRKDGRGFEDPQAYEIWNNFCNFAVNSNSFHANVYTIVEETNVHDLAKMILGDNDEPN